MNKPQTYVGGGSCIYYASFVFVVAMETQLKEV